jgi:hypothetical protein
MNNLDSFKLNKKQMGMIAGGGHTNAQCTIKDKETGVETPIDIYTTITDEDRLEQYMENSRPGYEVVGCKIN